MSMFSISRRAALAAGLGIALGGTRVAAQADDLSDIPNVNQLTEQERTTYRRRLQDATGDQQRAQIREEARVQAQQRAQLQQGTGQGSGSGQGAGGGQGRGQGSGGGQGRGGGQGGGGQGGGGGGNPVKLRKPGGGGG